jgi:hypothetical protein
VAKYLGWVAIAVLLVACSQEEWSRKMASPEVLFEKLVPAHLGTAGKGLHDGE